MGETQAAACARCGLGHHYRLACREDDLVARNLASTAAAELSPAPEAAAFMDGTRPRRPDAIAAEIHARERAERIVPEYSRTKAGPLSFGLTGRIVLTVLLILAPIWWFLQSSPVSVVIWVVIMGPFVGRDIWKRARIK